MISRRLHGLLNLHAAIVTLLAALWMLGCAKYETRLPWMEQDVDANFLPYVIAVAAAMLVSVRILHRLASTYHLCLWVDAARLTSRQVLLAALFVFGLMFALKDTSPSRVFISLFLLQLWVFLFSINVLLPRIQLRFAFQRRHRLPTVFIGSRSSQVRLRSWLDAKEALGIETVGFLANEGPPARGTDPGKIAPFLGELAALKKVIEENNVAQVILLEMPQMTIESRFVVDTCQQLGCRLLVYNNLPDVLRHPVLPVTEHGQQFYALQDEPLEDPLNRIAKRLFDIAVALPVVVFLLPMLTLFVWVGQRFQSPGPVLFAQMRTGQRRNFFRMYKFRTMRVAPSSEEAESKQATRDDQRIFPFGAFLRKTSLDEFPQFLNVLMGDMSIVGPRPHIPKHDENFARSTKGYRTRFYVKPGITGLAQSRGYRGEITGPQLILNRVTNDLEYISRWSFWLDVQITVKTALQLVFPPKTAY
jgi:exopolysaccharide biosynthesis polyprenyl glycosylphosphotransferase